MLHRLGAAGLDEPDRGERLGGEGGDVAVAGALLLGRRPDLAPEVPGHEGEQRDDGREDEAEQRVEPHRQREHADDHEQRLGDGAEREQYVVVEGMQQHLFRVSFST